MKKLDKKLTEKELKEIGKDVSLAIKKSGIKKKVLAEMAGISRGTIIAIEKGKGCQLSKLVEVCILLGVKVKISK